MPVRVAIVGSRDCKNLTDEQMCRYLPAECTHILSGGARGVDALARRLAYKLHLPYTEYCPRYAAFGKRAPLVRNRQMADQAQLVLAFWDFSSPGTRFTIEYCLQKHIPVRVVALEEAGAPLPAKPAHP